MQRGPAARYGHGGEGDDGDYSHCAEEDLPERYGDYRRPRVHFQKEGVVFGDENDNVEYCDDGNLVYEGEEEEEEYYSEGEMEVPEALRHLSFNEDIDSRSLTEQKHVLKQHWERQLSSTDVRLFPPPDQPRPAPAPESAAFVSSVEDSPIVLSAAKQQWEQKAALEREREQERERERETRQQVAAAAAERSMPSRRDWEMTEVDRHLKEESIIEKEIREDMERERALKQQGLVKSTSYNHAKEQEQSGLEPGEKPNPHESVIEREIREQREREAELQRLRQRVATPDPDPPAAPPARRDPSPQPARAAPPPAQPPPPPPTQQAQPPDQVPVQPPVQAPAQPREAPARPAMESKSMTYEAAISPSAHHGESLIAKEMREQREREDELRSHWKSLGLEVPAGSQEPPDTPYNRPDPHPATNKRLASRAPTSSYSKDVKPFKGAEGGRRGSVESADSSSKASSDRLDGRPKVQPFSMDEDEDEDGDAGRVFQPQSETPVEREIRLAREREEALRRERGLPLPAAPATPVDVPAIARSTSSEPRTEDDKRSMRRFASSRLQHEIEKEKRREQELRSEGKINTLSAERTGPMPKYTTIMSPDAGPPPSPLTQNSRPSPARSSPAARPSGPVVSSQREPLPVGESFIEQELREQRRREEQHRKEREVALGGRVLPATNGDAEPPSSPTAAAAAPPPPKSQSMDAIRAHDAKAADRELRAQRRKSALAEEWEKKFGGSPAS